MTLVSGSCVLEKNTPQEPCQMNKVFKAIFNQEFLAQDLKLTQYEGDSQVMKGYLLLSPEMIYNSTEIEGHIIKKISCRVSVCCQEKFVANVAFVGPEFLGTDETQLTDQQVAELKYSFVGEDETGNKIYSPSMVFSRGNFTQLDQNALAVNPNSLSQPIPVVELSGTFPIATVNEKIVTQNTDNSIAMTGSTINKEMFANSKYTVAGAVLIQVFVPKSPKAIVCVKAELGIELSE